MKKNLFLTVQRCIALVTTSALLFNIAGCGMYASKPSYARIMDQSNNSTADIESDSLDTSASLESPHVGVNDVDSQGNSVSIEGTSRVEGKTTIVDFSEVSSKPDGTVEADASGVRAPEQGSAPASGQSPSTQGSPFAAEPLDNKNTGGPLPRPGRSEEGSPNGNSDDAQPERKTYPSLGDFEKEVQNDREKIEGGFEKEQAGSQKNSPGAQALVTGAIDTHNADVNSALDSLPGWPELLKGSSNGPNFKTPASTPTGQGLRNAALSVRYTRSIVPGAPGDILDTAERTIRAADEAAAQGKLNDAEKRRQTARDLVNTARCPSCIPPPPKKEAHNRQPLTSEQSDKSKSYAAAKDLYDAANELDQNGLPGLANDTRKAAAALLNIALGFARVATVVDIPLNILEAFAQKTVEFDDSGAPQIVDASSIEVAFAVGTLAFLAAGGVAAGWTAAMGAGVLVGIGKAVEKQMVKHAAEKAAVEIAEKGLAGAEKEAFEQAAREVAAAETKAIGKNASTFSEDVANSITRSVITPYGKAIQDKSGSALGVRAKIKAGGPMYRVGTTGVSNTGSKAQFWSPIHPLTPGYAKRFGIPPENIEKLDFIERAIVKPDGNFITRPAPGIGPNSGGEIEIVVEEGQTIIQSFHKISSGGLQP